MRGEALQAFAAAALMAGLPACSDTNVCGARREELRRADGGSHPCVLASDCPRPGNALVCLDDNVPIQECVRCEESPGAEGNAASICVRIIPEPCQ